MLENKGMLTRYLKIIINILVLFVLGWGFTPYTTIFNGLILGAVASTYNMWLLYRKVNKFGQAVVENRRMGSLGMLQRMASSVLAVLIAMRYPETFHLVSVIIGLMTYYIVIMIDFIIQSKRNSFGKRGE
ncbi:ATP synthase subunit I [Bacillus sp. Marseille-P3661]|uniref:ATP synthase subunit I n=1 Tax=Bacillus sp. Marseille-P3661 TaxID=1936234 RepID=UPI000C862348|nr:ATP synthase subunit I [Bacillus sp. Marseille-P3661]